MGQAHSRGELPPNQRNRLQRPQSLRPTFSPPPSDQELSEMIQQPTSSRPISQRFLTPLSSLLSNHRESPDAGPSGPDAALSQLNGRRSRLSRARSSISSIPTMLLNRRPSSRLARARSSPLVTFDPSSSYNPTPPSSSSLTTSPPASTQHTPTTISDESAAANRYLPPIPDLDLNFEGLANHARAASLAALSSRPTSSRREGRPSMLPTFRPDRSIRNMTNSLRRRRGSPSRRDEDQAATLSRLLSYAAAATAASLMGEDHQAVADARSVPGDGEDGTFDSFLQALQNGRIASALRQSGSNNEEGIDTLGGSPPPLNFFRMFRFGSSNSARVNQNRPVSNANSDGEEETDGRMVPIIIVGIRSINPGSGNEREDNIPPFLDALSSFPPNMTSPGEEMMDGMLRQPRNGTRFSHRRRASMGGMNMNNHSTAYDSQRHWRSPERPRPWSTAADSPPGPLPPPSTPASSGLSAISSGTTTPIAATPPSPTIQSSTSSRRESFVRRTTGANLEPTVEEPPVHQQRTPRQRRLSDSDFPTRFGSGSSRRNGVVEPDNNPGEGSRSWIIYVLGGSYPEDHPILTTPSLFTGSPTYEDMLLLSSFLGPVKPPVASEEDVAAAPGLYRIINHVGTLVAQAVEGSELVVLPEDARCLVCLADFEIDEETRKLATCGHMFHRPCIDQWLTTGRNSCPLCRSQGVAEKEPSSPLTVTNPDLEVDMGGDSSGPTITG
ncbi:unnamed protein product [Periconia digitata]|uniref:RING-type domain-containing protein n=1 Tax=Periconia digitata TaxID=1303443 RepID=A0A9W4XN00_9PLEO|nr:unnamed protein product [Periconia digitata]